MSAVSVTRRGFAAAVAAWGSLALDGRVPRELAAQDQPTLDQLVTADAQKAIDAGLVFLTGQQNADGTFGSSRQFSGNVAVCSLAGLALLSQGSTPHRGPLAKNIRDCLQYVRDQAQDSGFICNTRFPSSGPMYGHGFATLLLAEAFGMDVELDLKETLSRAVKLIIDTQNDEGGWRYQPIRRDADISVTVCQIMALRAAKNAGLFVPATTVDRCAQYVKRCQNPDGGFCYRLDAPRESEFPRSAAAIVALQSAGIYEGPEIEMAFDYLSAFQPNRSQDEQSGYYYYGHYYSVQAMWHAGGRRWSQWYTALRDDLIRRQESRGNWTSQYSDEYATAMALIALQMPNNILPIFQR